MFLKGKTAVVTGASSGIGRAIAQLFAAEGAGLALCSRNTTGLHETLQTLPKGSGRRRAYELDVGAPDQIIAVIDAIIADLGRIDILVSNAGVVTRGSILELPQEEWDLIYRVNVRGPFLLTKAVAKHMVEGKAGGVILYIASTAGKSCGQRMPHYASSKAALIHFARCAALEFGPYKIRVNAICPGPTDTPFLQYPRPIPKQFIQRHNIVLGRIATPEDVAQAALFLASPAAGHITGQALNVDGGEAML